MLTKIFYCSVLVSAGALMMLVGLGLTVYLTGAL